jgi:hypothetical protein
VGTTIIVQQLVPALLRAVLHCARPECSSAAVTRFVDAMSRFRVQLDILYVSFPTLTLLMKKKQVSETVLNPLVITKEGFSSFT